MNFSRRKLNVGIIGLGHQSIEDHVPAVLASKDTELVAVADIDKGKLKAFSEQNKTVHTYESFEELFRSEKLDFVIIVVPHHLHSEVIRIAIKYHVHILKEKPFAVSIAQAKEFQKLARENNIKIAVTLQRRFNPIYSTFFQFIDKIGTPFFIESKYTFYTDIPHTGWRGRKELAGGGCLIDMGYHAVDLLIWFFGLPDFVFAETSCAAKEGFLYNAEDTAQVIFRYENRNLFGSLLLSRSMYPKMEFLDVYGTRGTIHIERGKIERRIPSGEIQESLMRENYWPSAAQDQIEYFVKVLRGEKENMTGPEFNLNHVAFIEAAYHAKVENKFISPGSFL